MEKKKVNRQHKDRLFRMLFGSSEMKENIVSLYNALNGTAYTVDDEVKITTIEEAIYITMKNDVSFLLDSHLSLWEHQSTYNPNMPLRGLMYYGKMYEAYVDMQEDNIFGSRLIKVPTPQYIVFYNGTEDRPAVETLKLSDAFLTENESGDFEWTAMVYNLNNGKNDVLLAKCKPLGDYMTFVNYIREYEARGMAAEKAIDVAVDQCIDEDILTEFLKKHRAEVRDVCLTEFDEEKFVKSIRREGIDEGRKKGIEEGKVEGRISELISLVTDGLLTEEIAASRLNITVEEFRRLASETK